MIKKFIVIVLIHLGSIPFLSAQLVNLGGIYNIDLYKPYSKETRDSANVYGAITSYTYSATLHFNMVKTPKLRWNCGVSFKHGEQLIEEKEPGYYTLDYWTGKKFVPQILDLHSKSYAFGIYNEVCYEYKSTDKFSHQIGLCNELFIYEEFHSRYLYSGSKEEFRNIYSYGPNGRGYQRFLFSSTNLALLFRTSWKTTQHFSLSSKITAGTNIYSYWEEFQKYAWVGVGLEIGLIDRPVFRPEFKEKIRKFHTKSFHGKTE